MDIDIGVAHAGRDGGLIVGAGGDCDVKEFNAIEFYEEWVEFN